MASTSHIRVLRLSSSSTCSLIKALNTLRTVRMHRSHTPPWWEPVGGLKVHLTLRCSKKSWIWLWFQLLIASRSSLSPLKKLPPLLECIFSGRPLPPLYPQWVRGPVDDLLKGCRGCPACLCTQFLSTWWRSWFTFFFGHLKSFSGQSLCLQSTLDPIHRASVFLLLGLRPDIFPKASIRSKDSIKDSSEPSKISVVSSASWLNLNSVPFIFIPAISFFLWIASASTSTERTNR